MNSMIESSMIESKTRLLHICIVVALLPLFGARAQQSTKGGGGGNSSTFNNNYFITSGNNVQVNTNALAYNYFVGGGDMAQAFGYSKGLLTFGTITEQQIVSGLYWGDSVNDGAGEPFFCRLNLNNQPTWCVYSSVFKAGGIELTNYMIFSSSLDPGAQLWPQTRIDPLNSSNYFTTVSNYYATNVLYPLTPMRSNWFEYVAPTINDPNPAFTNTYLIVGICPTNTQSYQTLWSFPFADNTGTNFLAPTLLAGLQAGFTWYDPHLFWDGSKFVLEGVFQGTNVKWLTNNNMSSLFTFWQNPITNQASFGNTNAFTYYIEGPNTHKVGDKWYMVGTMIAKTNLSLGGTFAPIFSGYFVSSDISQNTNWLGPYYMGTFSTNLPASQYLPNHLELYPVSEQVMPKGNTMANWITTTNVTGDWVEELFPTAPYVSGNNPWPKI